MKAFVFVVWIALIGCFFMSRDPKYNPTMRDWREEWNRRRDEWSSMVADGALLEDLTYFIKDPANYDKVWAEVREAYGRIPLHGDKRVILLHTKMLVGDFTAKEKRDIVESCRMDALNIMMARRGKAQPLCPARLCKGIGEHTRRYWDETYYYWMYIQEELRAHGVPAELIFIYEGHTNDGRSFERAYPAGQPELFRYKPGRLEWLPTTFYRYDENGFLTPMS